MICRPRFGKSGSVAIGIIVLSIILLAAMLSLNTAALVTVGNTSRALDVARQNGLLAARLESATREAAQLTYGVALAHGTNDFETEVRSIATIGGLGAARLKTVTVGITPAPLRFFPDLAGDPAPLRSPSQHFNSMARPRLRALCGIQRGTTIAESDTFEVRYTFSRPGQLPESEHEFAVAVECRLVATPLTRHGVMPYELPAFVGAKTGAANWPVSIDPVQVGPLGLVGPRDPAEIRDLVGVSEGPTENRPGYYRYLAALADAYQYVFSDTYLQRVADYAGATHFVQVGGGTANPALSGGREAGAEYLLDVGAFGRGSVGAHTSERRAAVFTASAAGARLVLSDGGGSSDAILLLVAGPGGSAPAGRLELALATDIARPVVIVCYNVDVTASGARRVNGALLLDHSCRVSSSVGPITAGHLSYSSSGHVSPDAFRLHAMSETAEALAPRVVYVATSRTVL